MAANVVSFFALPWRERRLLATAMAYLPLTALALKVMPFGKLRAIVDRQPKAPIHHDRQRADRIAHMVAAAAEYGPYRATCVPQSLVLQWLLRRRGMRGEVRYGARRIDGTMTTHCWVELDGEPLIDSADVRNHFAELVRTGQ